MIKDLDSKIWICSIFPDYCERHKEPENMVIIISFCSIIYFLPAKPFLWSDVGCLCVKVPKK